MAKLDSNEQINYELTSKIGLVRLATGQDLFLVVHFRDESGIMSA